MKNYINNQLGEAIEYDAAVMLMDADICEELHQKFAPCTNQKFYDEYCKMHREKFNEDFAPDIGLAW